MPQPPNDGVFTPGVTLAEANAPKPKPPDNINPQAWQYYYEDLACWRATKAEQITYGIREA